MQFIRHLDCFTLILNCGIIEFLLELVQRCQKTVPHGGSLVPGQGFRCARNNVCSTTRSNRQIKRKGQSIPHPQQSS